jgi:hypothetical protein
MRFVICAIILFILSIFAYFIYQTLPAHPSDYRMLLAIGVVMLLGKFALVVVLRRSPYHRIVALTFFAAYILLVVPVAHSSTIKHSVGLPAIGILMLAIDALIFLI